ncbi:MAG: hypothetical protein J5802_03755 [Butyrivibrio sp.]|nr:hypothetical protein [Butyrivibrio sp.]
MFEYKLPILKKEITAKRLSIFFTVAYILCVIPMLIMAFYDFPSADDFSMPNWPHRCFAETGNVFLTVVQAFAKVGYIYQVDEGYFFSALLTTLSPAAYGEQFYFLGPVFVLGMLTFGVCYFYNALFVKVFKADKHLTNTTAMITLIMLTQFIKDSDVRVEAIYWYSGAINYTFTFGMAFFWLGLLIRCVYDEDEKKRRRMFIWACIWGVCMGGANFMTALEIAICSILLIVIIILSKKGIITLYGADDRMKKSFNLLIYPAVLDLIGFGILLIAPGNWVRSDQTTAHLGPVASVLRSLYSTFDVIINKMMRWESLLFFLLFVPIFWKMGKNIKYRFRHPFVFTVFAYAMISSNFTPLYFGTGDFESGRVRALAWMEFVILAALNIFYVTVWIRQYLEENKGLKSDDAEERFSNASSAFIMTLLLLFAYGSILCVKPDYHYYSTTSCLYDLATGTAAGYKAENDERLKILHDPSVKTAVLQEHAYKPQILFHSDISADDWAYHFTCDYYNKDEIVMNKIERENDEE